MYLAHINFRPCDDAVLLDTVLDDRAGISVVRGSDEEDATAADHRLVTAGQAIDPELVLVLDQAADAEGWAHALQCHPDGSADVVSHRPEQLPFSVRWMVRDGDQDALGLILPATAPPLGRAAIRRAGHTVRVEPSGTFVADFRIGALEAEAAADMRTRIQTIQASAGTKQ